MIDSSRLDSCDSFHHGLECDASRNADPGDCLQTPPARVAESALSCSADETCRHTRAGRLDCAIDVQVTIIIAVVVNSVPALLPILFTCTVAKKGMEGGQGATLVVVMLKLILTLIQKT